MANSLLKRASPLARITTIHREHTNVLVRYDSDYAIKKAELNYTTDSGSWEYRYWQTMQADLDANAYCARAILPEDTTAYYFNLIDGRDLVVSSEHQEIAYGSLLL